MPMLQEDVFRLSVTTLPGPECGYYKSFILTADSGQDFGFRFLHSCLVNLSHNTGDGK